MESMAMSTAVHNAAGVIVGKRALHQLRTVLERETGVQAPLLLREVGFATGEALYQAFEAWTRTHYAVETPRGLDHAYLTEALAGFFADAGWGTTTLTVLTPVVLALDAPDWAEAMSQGAEYPSCHFSS